MRWTKKKVREFIGGYAWLGTPEEREAEVACIMRAPLWEFEVMQEHYRGMVESPGDPGQIREAEEFALTAFYETHGNDGKHTATCPRRPKIERAS